ncbi:MAG: ester cyclase [Chloroflexota bacterium]
MSNPQNEALVRRLMNMLTQPYDQKDAEQLVTPNWYNNDRALEGVLGHALRGYEGLKGLHDSWSGFSDMKVTIEDMFSDGDWVACHFHLQGKHTGNLMGMPATGKTVDITATGMFRFEDGKIAENIVNPDLLTMLQQLGAVPLPAQPKAA